MNNREFDEKLQELVYELKSLAPTKSSKSAKYDSIPFKSQSHKKLTEKLESINDSLDFLRLTIKYVMFDLEATRRENDYLKRMLKDK